MIEKIITDKCNGNIPEYMIPREVVILETLPLTAIGKVDFKMLEEMAENS